MKYGGPKFLEAADLFMNWREGILCVEGSFGDPPRWTCINAVEQMAHIAGDRDSVKAYIGENIEKHHDLSCDWNSREAGLDGVWCTLATWFISRTFRDGKPIIVTAATIDFLNGEAAGRPMRDPPRVPAAESDRNPQAAEEVSPPLLPIPEPPRLKPAGFLAALGRPFPSSWVVSIVRNLQQGIEGGNIETPPYITRVTLAGRHGQWQLAGNARFQERFRGQVLELPVMILGRHTMVSVWDPEAIAAVVADENAVVRHLDWDTVQTCAAREAVLSDVQIDQHRTQQRAHMRNPWRLTSQDQRYPADLDPTTIVWVTLHGMERDVYVAARVYPSLTQPKDERTQLTMFFKVDIKLSLERHIEQVVPGWNILRHVEPGELRFISERLKGPDGKTGSGYLNPRNSDFDYLETFLDIPVLVLGLPFVTHFAKVRHVWAGRTMGAPTASMEVHDSELGYVTVDGVDPFANNEFVWQDCQRRVTAALDKMRAGLKKVVGEEAAVNTVKPTVQKSQAKRTVQITQEREDKYLGEIVRLQRGRKQATVTHLDAIFERNKGLVLVETERMTDAFGSCGVVDVIARQPTRDLMTFLCVEYETDEFSDEFTSIQRGLGSVDLCTLCFDPNVAPGERSLCLSVGSEQHHPLTHLMNAIDRWGTSFWPWLLVQQLNGLRCSRRLVNQRDYVDFCVQCEMVYMMGIAYDRHHMANSIFKNVQKLTLSKLEGVRNHAASFTASPRHAYVAAMFQKRGGAALSSKRVKQANGKEGLVFLWETWLQNWGYCMDDIAETVMLIHFLYFSQWPTTLDALVNLETPSVQGHMDQGIKNLVRHYDRKRDLAWSILLDPLSRQDGLVGITPTDLRRNGATRRV